MSKIKPGETYDPNNVILGKRDAFHVASILVTTDDDVVPGSNVKFIEGGKKVIACHPDVRQAIVDPFVSVKETEEKAFWVFLIPGTVSDLSHSFSVDGLDYDHEPEKAEDIESSANEIITSIDNHLEKKEVIVVEKSYQVSDYQEYLKSRGYERIEDEDNGCGC